MIALALALTLFAQDRPTPYRAHLSPPADSGLQGTGFGWAAATRRDGFDRYDVFRSSEGRRVVIQRQRQGGDLSWSSSETCPAVDTVMAAYSSLSFSFDTTPPARGGAISIPPTNYLRWVWWTGPATRDVMVEATEGAVKAFVDGAVSELERCWQPSPGR